MLSVAVRYAALLLLPLTMVSAQPSYAPSVRPLPTRALMPVANVNEVIRDSEGYMWYATYEGGVCRDNGYQIDVFRKDMDHGSLLTDNMIYSLCEAPNGEIWFSTAQTVYALDKHDYSIRPLNDDLRTVSALHMRQLDNGNMLVEADTMVYEVTADHVIVASRHVKYRGRRVIAQPDGDGGFWICHYEQDLCYALGDTANVVRRYDLAPKNILVDTRRQLLFAITPGGLQVMPIDRGRLGDCIYCYDDIPEIGVYGLYLDNRSNLWMTGYQPSFTIFTTVDDDTKRKLNISSPRYDEVYVDYLQPMGNGRLAVFKDISFLSEYDLTTDTERLVASDTVSPATTRRGRQLPLAGSLPDIDTLLVKDATTDDRGHLWVVFDQYVREINTESGRYRDVSVTGCDMDMNNFCCIAPVERGVCVGGAGGVCFFASDELLDDGDMVVPASVSSYEVTSRDGRVEKGFLYSDGSLSALSLTPDCSCLTLYLTTFNQVNAPMIRFAVKVEGWNDDWVFLAPGENVFRMLNIPKGHYRVMLRATDENGLWGNQVEALLIDRRPAWWESWWAYVGYALLLTAALTGAFWLYRYIRRRREQFDNMLRLLAETGEAKGRQEKSGGAAEERTGKPDGENAGEAAGRLPDAAADMQEATMKTLSYDFRNKAIALVKANLSNDDYTVDMLADALCMSRVNLYRKMMTICGQTPSDFIRTMRMEQAYHLLTTTDLPVNIVAGECGFTSSSYFAKCFKNRFGMLPTALR